MTQFQENELFYRLSFKSSKRWSKRTIIYANEKTKKLGFASFLVPSNFEELQDLRIDIFNPNTPNIGNFTPWGQLFKSKLRIDKAKKILVLDRFDDLKFIS